MAKLPDDFNVPFAGPDCPICKSPVVLQCAVRIKQVNVRITGSDSFSSNMAVAINAEVIDVVADHGCKPRKES